MGGMGSIALFCVLLAAGGEAPPVPDKPLYGGAIQRAVQVIPTPVDPATARSALEREVASLFHPRLLLISESGALEGGAVESWRVSPDGLTYTLALRSGVRDGGGRRLKAEDVIFSLERLLRENPGSAAGQILLDLEGTGDFVSGRAAMVSGLRAADEETVVLVLGNRQPLLLEALADINAAPGRRAEVPGELMRGWGPFIEGGGGRFVPNLFFFRGRPFLDHLFLGATEVRVDPSWRRPVLARLGGASTEGESLVPIEYPGSRCVYLAANPRRPALRGAPARRAVFSAIDPESMVNIFFSGRALLMPHLVPESALPGEIFSEPDTGPPGGPPGGGPVERLTIGYPAGDAALKLVAERLRVDLLVAGVSADVTPYERGSARRCDLLVVEALIADGGAAYSICRLLSGLAGLSGDPSWLRRPSGDPAAWLAGLEKELVSEALLLPLYSAPHRLYADPRIRRLRFRPDGTLDYEGAWIADDLVGGR